MFGFFIRDTSDYTNSKLYLSKKSIDDFIKVAKETDNEVCGVLLGSIIGNNIYAYKLELIDNASEYNKKTTYMLEPKKYLEVLKQTTLINKNARYNKLIIIHSHPQGPSILSETDMEEAVEHQIYLIYDVNLKNLTGYYCAGIDPDINIKCFEKLMIELI